MGRKKNKFRKLAVETGGVGITSVVLGGVTGRVGHLAGAPGIAGTAMQAQALVPVGQLAKVGGAVATSLKVKKRKKRKR